MPAGGQWVPATVAEVFGRALALAPSSAALVTRSGRYTYAELDALADRAAHALAGLGVRAGDRVAASLPNDTDVVVAFHGAMRLGAVWWESTAPLRRPRRRSSSTTVKPRSCCAIPASPEEMATITGGLRTPPRVTVCGAHEASSWAAALAAADEGPVGVVVDPGAPAGIAYTSGRLASPRVRCTASATCASRGPRWWPAAATAPNRPRRWSGRARRTQLRRVGHHRGGRPAGRADRGPGLPRRVPA